MNLYQLQIAYLSGVQVASNPEADLSAAIAAYEHALALEPTWDTGWINLAILQERSGLFEAAVRSMDKARNISELNNAALHWARLAEQIGGISAGAIIDGYLVSITEDSPNIDIPLSGFWDETELRRMARDQYTRLLDADLQYRVFAVHAPELAASLVLTDLQTTQDWWIAGQHTLVVGNDPEAADAFFTEAIRLDRTNGDYYASRARARLEHNPDAARRDLDLAQLLGTLFEYPNAIRAELADSAEEAQALHANALPARSIGQEFAAVLYGRVSGFDVFPEARRPGPGRAAMQPWYVIAEDYLRDGHIAEAITVYDAILDYAPYEIEAQLQREELQNSRG
jgi:tetratricopeptide (TPR) repeat protein